MKHLKKALPVIGLITTVFAMYILTALPVHAAGGLDISTTYPGTTVTAGKATNFSLTLTNSGFVPLNAAVSVSDVPAGWSATLTGGGNTVSRVYVQAESTSTVSLSVDVPANATEGEYTLRVTANADDVAYDTLYLVLDVSATESSQGMFTTQFPELQGGSTVTFTFNANLTNNGAEDSYYSLAADYPPGWTVGFRPTSGTTDIASLMVAAGQSQALTVSVKPPADIAAGEYIIPCTAISANDSATLDLKVIITGSYALTLATKDGRLNAEAEVKKESPITLVVTNTGSTDITDITMTSQLPTSDWTMRFDIATIDVLPVGASQEIIAYIQPMRAVTGDYAAGITAGSVNATANVALRVAVETSTLWGVVAIIIIAAIAVGLYFVFKKFGRR